MTEDMVLKVADFGLARKMYDSIYHPSGVSLIIEIYCQCLSVCNALKVVVSWLDCPIVIVRDEFLSSGWHQKPYWMESIPARVTCESTV